MKPINPRSANPGNAGSQRPSVRTGLFRNTGANRPQGPSGPSDKARPSQGQRPQEGPSDPEDRVTLSDRALREKSATAQAGAAPDPDPGFRSPSQVDPERQEQTVEAQEQELEANPRENTRPADGGDAERYNELLQEAARYGPGTHETEDGTVTVTEEDGVKTLRFNDGRARKVIVDSNTGDVSESVTKPRYANGPNYREERVTSYDRRGDVLGPVYEDRGPVFNVQGPSGNGASYGPPEIYSTAPRPKTLDEILANQPPQPAPYVYPSGGPGVTQYANGPNYINYVA